MARLLRWTGPDSSFTEDRRYMIQTARPLHTGIEHRLLFAEDGGPPYTKPLGIYNTKREAKARAEEHAAERAPAVRQMRPLKRIAEGVWESRDGRWKFVQEPVAPRQWFAYFLDEPEPDDGAANIGSMTPTLKSVVAWAEREDASMDRRVARS